MVVKHDIISLILNVIFSEIPYKQLRKFLCDIFTPLGWPVEPDV